MNNKWILPGVLVVLLGISIFLIVQLSGERSQRKHLEEQIKDMVGIQEHNIESAKEEVNKDINDKQSVIDRFMEANRKDSIIIYNRTRYYEKELKRLKGITTVHGIDLLTDSILRANKVR